MNLSRGLKHLFFLFIVYCSATQANDFRSKYQETPIHRIANLHVDKHTGLLIKLNDGSVWRVRSSDNETALKHWKRSTDVVVCRSGKFFAKAPFWILHPKSNKYVYAAPLRPAPRHKYLYTVHKMDEKQNTLTLMRNKTEALTFKLKTPITKEFREQWKVGVGVSIGSNSTSSNKKRESHCFLINLATSDTCDADIILQ